MPVAETTKPSNNKTKGHEPMAAKKKKAKSKKTSALSKRQSSAVTNLSSDMNDFLESYTKKDAASAKIESGGFPFISTRAGMLRFEDEQLPNPMNIIILGAIRMNQYFGDEEFDPENPQPPICFALNSTDDESSMCPPESLEARISDACDGCPMNAFGSGGRTGKGKACRNSMRLAVLPYDDVKDFSKVGGARISIPPTSLKVWGPYAKKITEGLSRPLFSVISSLSITPDDKAQFVIGFELVETINDEDMLIKLAERVDSDGKASLESLPQSGGDAAEQQSRPARGKKRVAVKRGKKKAAKKKAARKR